VRQPKSNPATLTPAYWTLEARGETEAGAAATRTEPATAVKMAVFIMMEVIETGLQSALE